MAIKGEKKQPAAPPDLPPGAEWLDRVYCDDSRLLEYIPDGSMHLGVTSPPYNVGKGYEAGMTWDDWAALMHDSTRAVARKLVPGGRLAINVANTDRKPYRSLLSVIEAAMAGAQLMLKGHVIWNKGASVGTSTAWGSWQRPTAPELRDLHEYVVIAQKPGRYPQRPGQVGDCTPQEFTTYTKSVWDIPTVSGKRVGHEAPFHWEIPHRLIKLFTWPGDNVLDWFMGSGTTLLAARALGRHFVGVDQDPAACALAEEYLAGKRTRGDRPLALKADAGEG